MASYALVIMAFVAGVLIYSAQAAHALPRASVADNTESANARAYLSSMNSTRASHGLAPLAWSGTLAAGSQAHAETMGAQNRLFHASDVNANCSQAAAWSECAENVAMNTLGADSVSRAASQFLGSSGHRANIVNPRFNYAGVGVEHANGSFWIVVRFMSTGDAVAETPAPVASTPKPLAEAAQTREVLQQAAVQAAAEEAARREAEQAKVAPLSEVLDISVMFEPQHKPDTMLERLTFIPDDSSR